MVEQVYSTLLVLWLVWSFHCLFTCEGPSCSPSAVWWLPWTLSVAGRVAVAIQLRTMDAEVVAISRLLAVGALQVREDYVTT